MPIPKYNSGQIQERVTPQFQQKGDVPAEAFGGGRSSQAAMGAASRLMTQEKENADQLVITEKYAQIKQFKNDLVFNPETGLVNKKGKDSFSAPDEYIPQFDKTVEEMTKDLNSGQKAKIQKLILSEKLDLDETINRHMTQERGRYDEETTKSGLLASRDEAVKNYSDYSKVLAAIDSSATLIDAQAQRNGLGADWAKQQKQLAASSIHTGVVSMMLSKGDDLAASKYFAANKTYLSGEDERRIGAELEEGSLRGESQRISDGIMAKGLDLKSAMAEVRKIENPKVRDAAEARVKSDFGLREAEKRSQEERDFLQATNILERGGSYDQIPPSLIARLPLAQRSSLRSYMNSRESDPATYYDLKTMAATPDLRDKFLNTNLMDYAGKLSKSDFKDLITDQAALRKGDGKTSEELDGFLTDMQTVEGIATMAGFGDDKEKKAKFMAAVSREQAALEKRTGKKATSQDVTAIADQMLIKGKTSKGLLWDTEKQLFEAEDGEDFDIDIDQIPKAEVKRIQAYLKSINAPDSDTSILELYKKKLKGTIRGK